MIRLKNKVVLIGCGNVGMAYAFAIINQNVHIDELVLIDVNKDKVDGEVMDLNHSLSYSPNTLTIKSGTYEDCSNAQLVVITAGANQKAGETRLDLIKKNSLIMTNIIDNVINHNFNGIFLIASNPVDVMTHLTLKYSMFPSNKVFGSGTVLDTSRLRYMVSKYTKINPKNIQAYVIGEHGDSEFIPWSNATIALTNIDKFLSRDDMQNIEDEVRNAAYEIINKKGATAYGIGMCLVEITNAIFDNKDTILSISSYDLENDICISTPTIINRTGVVRKIHIPLNELESTKIKKSIKTIKEAYESINKTN